ncbi:unnamed protein product [Gadus morhua 'NCC']
MGLGLHKARVFRTERHPLQVYCPSITSSLLTPLQPEKMAMTSILSADDIKKALNAFAAADSFDHKKFFEVVGLKALSAEEVKKAFLVLDADNSGFIEEEELKFMLKGFSSSGRDLTDQETKAFLNAADKDGDGKIGVEEFTALVKE